MLSDQGAARVALEGLHILPLIVLSIGMTALGFVVIARLIVDEVKAMQNGDVSLGQVYAFRGLLVAQVVAIVIALVGLVIVPVYFFEWVSVWRQEERDLENVAQEEKQENVETSNSTVLNALFSALNAFKRWRDGENPTSDNTEEFNRSEFLRDMFFLSMIWLLGLLLFELVFIYSLYILADDVTKPRPKEQEHRKPYLSYVTERWGFVTCFLVTLIAAMVLFGMTVSTWFMQGL